MTQPLHAMNQALSSNQMGRRAFLKASSLFLGGVSGSAASTRFAVVPSQRINVGVIGLGARGFYLLRAFLNQPGVQVRAVCDVDRHHYRDKPWGKGQALGRSPARKVVESHYAARQARDRYRGCLVFEDYRDLCGRDDLDAIVVATPDHWHYHQVMASLQHGKDVYCEKPVTHTFMEGKILYREVKRRQAVFQTGSQQRSTANFHRAVTLLRNGHIGRLTRVEVGLPPGYTEPGADPGLSVIPETLDYEMWTGPAPMLPFARARHHRFWRGHRAYGGGNIMDWIGHHNDIAHWGAAMDGSGPLEVEALGWTASPTELYNTPVDYEIRCVYPGKIDWVIASHLPMGVRWIGQEGWIAVDRGRLEASDPRWIKPDFKPGPVVLPRSLDHVENFLHGVRTRQSCIAPAEAAHRSITPGHLGFASHTLGRRLHFDPRTERVLDDPEANALLDKSYRRPWSI